MSNLGIPYWGLQRNVPARLKTVDQKTEYCYDLFFIRTSRYLTWVTKETELGVHFIFQPIYIALICTGLLLQREKLKVFLFTFRKSHTKNSKVRFQISTHDPLLQRRRSNYWATTACNRNLIIIFFYLRIILMLQCLVTGNWYLYYWLYIYILLYNITNYLSTISISGVNRSAL